MKVVLIDGVQGLGLFALKDIPSNCEIRYDYNAPGCGGEQFSKSTINHLI